MEEEFSAMELAKRIGIHVVDNKLKLMAIRELLVEKEVFTDAEYQMKYLSLKQDKTEKLVKELLEIEE